MTDEIPITAKLKLDDVGGTKMELYELRWSLRQRITTATLVTAASNNALLALTREQFDFNGTVQDFGSALLEIFQIVPKTTPEEAVARQILGFLRLPRDEYEQLVQDAIADLKIVEDLIVYYETESAVQSSRNGGHPRNHLDYTKVIFYNRCLDERGRISRYLVDEASAKAIEHVDEDRAFLRKFFVRLEEPPYPLRYPRAIQQYDFRLINRWRHRLRALPLDEAHQLGEVYKRDPVEFYADLAKSFPISKIFEQIFQDLAKVEQLRRREAVFKEMKILHEHHHWYGLYALALPHVEGLFTEMLELATNRSAAGAALPEKVRIVRKYAAIHAQNMDYFEFVVPLERNQFSHTGKVENPELRATEVLHDLAYVLRVYVELETPVIELLALIRGGELENANSFAPWAHLFELVQRVDKNKQRDQISSELESFWLSWFRDETAKRNAIDDLCKALQERIKTLADRIGAITRDAGLEVDITMKRTQEMFERRDQLRTAISDATVADDNFFDVLDVRTMLRGISEECALPIDAQEKAASILSHLATPLENAKFLSETQATNLHCPK